MADGNEAAFSAPLVLVSDELLERWFQPKMSAAAAALTITDTHKTSSEVYGEIEGFTCPVV
jgi:hypothetical protein